MKEKEMKEQEELRLHQEKIVDRMSKMDTFMAQYQKRKDKLAEEEKKRVTESFD